MQDKVKTMTDKFLEYVMNNHDVNRQPFSMIHAFQLSLVRIFLVFSSPLFNFIPLVFSSFFYSLRHMFSELTILTSFSFPAVTFCGT